MKCARNLRFIPPWKYLRNWWCTASLYQVLMHQSWVQFCVRHRNRIERRLPTLITVVALLILRMLLLMILLLWLSSNDWRNSRNLMGSLSSTPLHILLSPVAQSTGVFSLLGWEPNRRSSRCANSLFCQAAFPDGFL